MLGLNKTSQVIWLKPPSQRNIPPAINPDDSTDDNKHNTSKEASFAGKEIWFPGRNNSFRSFAKIAMNVPPTI